MAADDGGGQLAGWFEEVTPGSWMDDRSGGERTIQA
jgi:hypothetical protein